jgi:hypothetical protein
MYNISESFIEIQNQSIPIAANVDVLVCGGGVAGIAAAVAAARTGAKTLLVERAGFLGGTATGSMMGLIVIPGRELTGFPREFFSRLSEDYGAGLGDVVPWDTEAYKLTALEMVLEAGAEVLLYTWISDPLVKDNRVEGIIIENKSGRQVILAKSIIDTSGDGDVSARAGVAFGKGREEDGAMRPVTVMGRFGNVNLPRLQDWIDANPEDMAQDDGRRVFDIKGGIVRIDGFFSKIEQAKKMGLMDPSTPINYLRFSGVVPPEQAEHANLICNSTRIYNVDGTNGADITRAEIEGRKQLRDIVKICQQLVPGFEKSYLVDTSSFIGVRETRRIKGRYTLTYEDISSKKQFSDSIAVMTSVDYGTAEVHSPDHAHEGSVNDQWARNMVLELTRFEFPVKCLLPEGFSNLIVAGRCCSMTHEVDKFARNMAPTGLMGQAAGTLGGIMAQKENADWENIPIEELRASLIEQGVPVSL